MKGKTLLYLVTEDWYFWSHRLPFARAAQKEGARIIVAARMADHEARIRAEGFSTVHIPFDRSGLNPIRDLSTLGDILRCYRHFRPDLVHHVALKPVLYGGMAAALAGIPAVVNAMTGLGTVFISNRFKMRLLRPVIKYAFRILNNRARSVLILQNGDDADLFKHETGIRPEVIQIVRGSGVDCIFYTPSPEPEGPPIATCVSRMLWDKGIGELVEAARLLKQRRVDITIRLVGPTDANPTSIPQAKLEEWHREGIVDVVGPSCDIAEIYQKSHIAVLPSYREGLPKSLLEAAACARPIVASDVPGCREICKEGITGLKVPAYRVEPLADALQTLAENPALRQQFGKGARRIAEENFAQEIVTSETLAIYRALLLPS